MRQDNDKHKSGIHKSYFFVLIAIIALVFIVGLVFMNNDSEVGAYKPDVYQTVEADQVFVNGIHQPTGLKEGEGLTTVVAHCTACHSAQLIIQNRMDEAGWNATIKWMQETQNLWDLGTNQKVIVDYLVNYYPVINKGRRENLNNIEWYNLPD